MPAVRLALHDVNRSPDVLPNHHLRMHWNNTAVSDNNDTDIEMRVRWSINTMIACDSAQCSHYEYSVVQQRF